MVLSVGLGVPSDAGSAAFGELSRTGRAAPSTRAWRYWTRCGPATSSTVPATSADSTAYGSCPRPVRRATDLVGGVATGGWLRIRTATVGAESSPIYADRAAFNQ